MLVDKAYYGIKIGTNDPWGLCGTPENSVCVIDPQASKSSLEVPVAPRLSKIQPMAYESPQPA